MLNLESVIFVNIERKVEKYDLIPFKAVKEVWIVSCCFCKVVTFACFNAVSEVIHEVVSNPELSPLKEIVIFLVYPWSVLVL